MDHTLIHSLLVILKAIVKGIVKIPLLAAMTIAGYYIWKQYQTPLDLIVGFPLMLLGLTMGILSVYDLIVALISSQWRRQHCPFCRSTGRVSEILSVHNGFHRK